MEVIALISRGFEIRSDRRGIGDLRPTLDNGGSDEGMSPPEFLLTSLATCAAYYGAQYLKTLACPPQT